MMTELATYKLVRNENGQVVLITAKGSETMTRWHHTLGVGTLHDFLLSMAVVGGRRALGERIDGK